MRSVVKSGTIAVPGFGPLLGRVETLPRPDVPARRAPLTGDPAEAVARIAIAGLFLALAVRIGENFLETGRAIGLLLLVSELLVVVLTLARRTALAVDRSWASRTVTALSLLGPPLVRPTLAPGAMPELVTLAVSAAGLVVVIGGKVSLGRSFGLMPANRGVVRAGLYRLVRHPIYLGYLVTHAAFLAANPTAWNASVLVGADAALVARALVEERTLSQDPEYARYQARVRWRLVPGVF